jgi:hypothetical protein
MIQREVTECGLRIVQIGFFRVNSCCSKYGHVEIRFSDGTITSITRDPGYVHFEPGRLMTRYNCFFQIHLTSLEEEAMEQKAFDAHQNKVPFSYMSMIWNFAPLTRNYPLNGEFCSSYVTKLLQMVGYCEELDPRRTSPDDLFKCLVEDNRVVVSVNRKIWSLTTSYEISRNG